MELKSAPDLIRQLKVVKKELEITYPRLMERIEKNGDSVSMSTLKRVFAEDSEVNDSFNYASTLMPIAKVLLDAEDVPGEENTAEGIEIAALKADIRVKNEIIEKLQFQIDELKKKVDAIKAEEARRLSFLRNQIELKDRRMDEKDEIIKRLMDKVL